MLYAELNNTLLKCACIFFIICLGSTTAAGQFDSAFLRQLIREANVQFLAPFASGYELSPYELRDQNRDRFIKNIELVDSYLLFRKFPTQQDTTLFQIKDNQTVVQKPDDKYNSHTFLFDKDGRILKMLRGAHLNGLFVYDDSSYLVQHGYGGELKKAERTGKTFMWFSVPKKLLEYTTAFDDQNRLLYIQKMGHHFGPAVESVTDFYAWNGDLLTGKTTVTHYKPGNPDSTFMGVQYDDYGNLKSLRAWEDGYTNGPSTHLITTIEYPADSLVKISIASNDKVGFSITYDQYGNWVEKQEFGNVFRREINYRKRKRRK